MIIPEQYSINHLLKITKRGCKWTGSINDYTRTLFKQSSVKYKPREVVNGQVPLMITSEQYSINHLLNINQERL